jgi:anti-sigma-K factor RskA
MDEHIEELFPFYALGAVTEEERAEVEAYVQANAAALARLEAAVAAADNLAFLAESMAPAAPVKDNVLAYARRRPHLAAAPTSPAPTALPTWWQRWRQGVVLPLWAGLATAAAVVLFIWLLSLQTTISNLEGQVAALRPLETTVPELQEQVQTLQRALEQQDEILAVLPGGRGLSIAGTEVQPDAMGQLVVGADGQTAVLAVSNLAVLPDDQTYQLWLIGEDGPVSEGVFTVDAEGEGLLTVRAASAVFSYDTIGISIEPEGGSLQPTGDIVMLSDIPVPDSGS